jgi:filamentous hemagglutinin
MTPLRFRPLSALCWLAFFGLSTAGVLAGDILRGGAAAGQRGAPSAAARQAAAAAMAARSQDRLATTSQTVVNMRAIQAAARQAAAASSQVPDGLAAGGLKVLTGANARWSGAAAPTQAGHDVNIVQNAAQAVLHWETFNVGRNTTVNFDQSQGGAAAGEWIAFNKVFDPSARPSQILGRINAQGQIYILNQNGIIFGTGSQVNARALVASSLPINDRLVERGLLNQEAGKAFEFLFSAAPGTTPGDVIVERGATISSPVSADGNGGRIMLVGPNVRNSGTLSASAGQTILAAGRQVGIDAHRALSANTPDPSLRGIDVYVGDVGSAGTAVNDGLIESSRGSVLITGRSVIQSGVIESSTSVSLNGRVDLVASYGAVPNAAYQPSVFRDNVTPFSFTSSGTVTLGSGSLIRILPEVWSTEKTTGTRLALRSAVNIEGRNIYAAPGSTILAPNARANLRAGSWYVTPEGEARLISSGGQVYLDRGSLIDVSGSMGVLSPLSNYVLSLELRGAELANSVLQRNGNLRGTSLTVDLRRSGVYGGRQWVGTPLGDVSGFAALIERDAGQLTLEGGTVNISAGDSVVMQPGSIVDVSGGWTQIEGGTVRTTRVLSNGRLIDIADATPDLVYDSIFTGTSTRMRAKWGVSETHALPLAPTGETYQESYHEGADAGSVSISAPAMALDGELLGQTAPGPKQLRPGPDDLTIQDRTPALQSNMPKGGSLALSFSGQTLAEVAGRTELYTHYPTPPAVTFGAGADEEAAPFGEDADGRAAPLAPTRLARVNLSPELFAEARGFSSLTINNEDGTIDVPVGVTLDLPSGGELSFTAANIAIGGRITAPGGRLAFTALNVPPFEGAKLVSELIDPVSYPGRGVFTLGAGAVLSTAGLVTDDRPTTTARELRPFAPDGGSVSIAAYSASLAPGSVVDVSGGFSMPATGALSRVTESGRQVVENYGHAGSISIKAGREPNAEFLYAFGGKLDLGATLRGLAGGGAHGGSLSISAPSVLIGEGVSTGDRLVLAPSFFNTGGFESFSLAGLGLPAGGGTTPQIGLEIAPGTVIEPAVQSVLANLYSDGGAGISLVPINLPAGQRRPVNLEFRADGILAPNRSAIVRGDLVLGEGAVIRTDPGSSVAFKGMTAAILGAVYAPGGSISVTGSANSGTQNRPPLFAGSAGTEALTTVYLGPRSVLSATGALVPDALDRRARAGTVLPGGSILVAGNIVAASGAVLDVSGASAIVDMHPSEAAPSETINVPRGSGLTAPLFALQSVSRTVDSDGGVITLDGGQMLYSDATLLGRSGGATASGGRLIVSSGRFYADETLPAPPTDINLSVTQSSDKLTTRIPAAAVGIGQSLRGADGAVLAGRGFFAADDFQGGGFDSLELLGTVGFSGDVSIAARKELWVSDGGILQADGRVSLSAAYAAIGKPFSVPVRAGDEAKPFGSNFAPTYGTGQLNVSARWIDLGSLSLQGIGRASLAAPGGDIRGVGTFNMAGDLSLQAGQIYPATGPAFTLVAYDYQSGASTRAGSISIIGSGQRNLPLSAVGSLGIYASSIFQGGTLRAPFGQITLGWDGTGTAPVDLVAGNQASFPVTKSLVLAAGSVTSVSAVDPLTGEGLVVPFGLSSDGQTWISPTGADISVAGLPEKRVTLSAGTVVTEAGSTIDLSGGGDLAFYRWINGEGGSADLLGTTTSGWNSGAIYRAGDLVLHSDGSTYSARRDINPVDFAGASAPNPADKRYWVKIPESYAVLPGYESDVAPFAPFNTVSRVVDDVETNLNAGRDAGYVSRGIRPGDKIYLAGGSSLAAGHYTLLPSRYALLPGAVLVTPTARTAYGAVQTTEGASLVAGYRFNSLNPAQAVATAASQFEVITGDVLRERAEYEEFLVDAFLQDKAASLGIESPVRPSDAGYGLIRATDTMSLRGGMTAGAAAGGRGARLDLSSPRDFLITAGDTAVAPGRISLDANVLNSFGVESLLIGGARTSAANGTTVAASTGTITLANAGSVLAGPEIILAANAGISLAPGAALASSGAVSRAGSTLLVNGNGALVRISADSSATMRRSGLTAPNTAVLSVGAGSSISGGGITLDSSASTSLDPTARLAASAYYFGSGRISLQLDNPGALQPTTGLVLGTGAIAQFQTASLLSLLSYSSLDVYGTGTVGSSALANLVLNAGQVRGFNQNGGTARFLAGNILLGNEASAQGPGIATAASGSLAFDAAGIQLGANTVNVDQFQRVGLNAGRGLNAVASGVLSVSGDVNVTSPLVTAAAGLSRTLTSSGNLVLAAPSGAGATTGAGGLGATYQMTAASINAASSILLPSGSLTLRAVSGDLNVTGLLDVGGTAQNLYDVTRFTDAGRIQLTADAGDVVLGSGSTVNVSAQPGGANAGSLGISTANGTFTAAGSILGRAGLGGQAGSFALDTSALPSLAALSTRLTTAGLVKSQNIRVRTGNVDADGTARASDFALSADLGSITVSGRIDASGLTGGSVALAANGDVTMLPGSVITVAGQTFDHAGKGGSVRLEAGAQRNGVAVSGFLDLRAGATVDLSVASKIAGSELTPGTSAYLGQFSGELHLRAPQNASFTDLNVRPIDATIVDASSILAEGYRLYAPSGGSISSALQTTIFNNAQSFLGAAGVTTAGYTAMNNRLLANNPGLADLLVVAPGVEIINLTGNLTLGTTSSTSTSDWNLSTFRFGAKSAPGVLSLRAAGDLVFLNTLSDGFSPTLASSNPSWLWLAQPTLLNSSPLPMNTRSWSYRLVSGADFTAANALQTAATGPGTGSIQLGKNGGNNSVTGGDNALTAAAVARWYQVIRTGSGDIDLSARGNIQLLNQLASIYTAGTRVFNSTLDGAFTVPSLPNLSGDQGLLGANQQTYPARYTMAGGDVTLSAGGNIERLTRNSSNQLVADSSRQLPNNWLYRRGYIDPQTGEFGVGRFNDATSTTWWVDFSNFFQGVAALGGGNVTMLAAGDISNVDGSIPTNARLTSESPETGTLVELGGGDLLVRAGRNIDAGVYYVQRGSGTLEAGGSIVSNATRSPSTRNLTTANTILDSSTWLPTTLFLGQGGFDVKANGDILLGPVGNVTFMPQGLGNSFWYKTYFSTYDAGSYVNVSSLGGDVTLRTEAIANSTQPRPLLQVWAETQQLLRAVVSSSFYQPWLRLAESAVSPFETITSLLPPTLRATAFSGDIALAGDLTFVPSATGTLELLAGGGILGLQQTGAQGGAGLWTASTINLSDANPASIPGVRTPFAFQTLVGTASPNLANTTGANDFLQFITDLFAESGATTGSELSIQKTQARHTAGLLHLNDPLPLRLYAGAADVSGLTLFSAKRASILAGGDISDVAFYIQNLDEEDNTVIGSGGDIVPYQQDSALRQAAVGGGGRVISAPLAGDLQISGPGTLQVLAGGDVDLGTGRENVDGTGVGITSVGNLRNPFLPATGADLIIGAGLGSAGELSSSGLRFDNFIESTDGAAYLAEVSDLLRGRDFSQLSRAERDEIALQIFYLVLRDAGRTQPETGNYDRGFAAINSLFGALPASGGDILTRERDLRTKAGGGITIFAPDGGLTLAKASSGARLAPPGIVTESGGTISIFTKNDVSIGDGRIFVLRGGNQVIWSSTGDIAAGSAAKTVQSARPTQVVLDPTTASVKTDLAGLATGGGIGVLATVEGVEPGDVDLIAPAGIVDAGDAGIRASGNLNIAAEQVVNADNIAADGTSAGVPSAPVVAAPNISGLTSGASSTAATSTAAQQLSTQSRPDPTPAPEPPSIVTVEVLGYGGGESDET